ncbi:MAG: hypothetical protein WAM04_20320 [Candidatus Sulfotelmatobacter sp.]
MRWTFWLSAIGVPFSYGITIVLARAGTEVIGTFGLLMVYIGLVASLFYLGGDSVIIKFVPELNTEQRLSFLVSYLLIVLGFMGFCLGIAVVWPLSLQYLFGNRGGARFQFQMLCLSPVYVLFSLVVAAHKAVLEMRWAQMLMRALTIGSFLLYTALYLGWRSALNNHYTGLIWGTYLGLTAVATGVGLRHLLRMQEWSSDWGKMRLFLPRGFWHYLLTTEEVSLVGFLMQRLDLILIMNLGGLSMLGKYVAVVTVAGSIGAANRLFVDTLLPSLTNTISTGNVDAVSQVVTVNLRLLFLFNLAGMGAMMSLTDPILHFLGHDYGDLRSPFILLVLFIGLAAPGAIGGTLLSAVSKLQHVFWVYVAQLISFVTLFAILWQRWHILGAILANGVSVLGASVLLLAVAKWNSGIKFAVYADYFMFSCVGSAAGAVLLHWKVARLGLDLLVWTTFLAVFLLARKYSLKECKQLIGCFAPSSFGLMRAEP